MASIIKNCRGIRAKEITHVILMTDDEYNFYLNEVQALSKKEQKQWKRRNEKTDRSTSTIRFDGKNLYTQWLNCRVEVKSQSMMAAIQQADVKPADIIKHQFDNFQDTDALHNAMDQMQIETHTGKHNPRNHPVRVPTCAGEPVRA